MPRRSVDAMAEYLATHVGAARRDQARALQRDIDERDLSTPEAVRLAMQTRSKLWLVYNRKRDGRTLEYHVAPYEVGEHPASGAKVLWATDHKHGGNQIHAFLWNRIEEAEPRVTATFRPAWPIQQESV